MNTELTRLGMAMIRMGVKHCTLTKWADFVPAIVTPVDMSEHAFLYDSYNLDHRYTEPPCA